MAVLVALFLSQVYSPGSASAAEVVANSPDGDSVAVAPHPGQGIFRDASRTDISPANNVSGGQSPSGKPLAADGDDPDATVIRSDSTTLVVVALLLGSLISALLYARLGLQIRSKTKLLLDPENPFRLISGNGVYTMSVTSGQVLGAARELETQISESTTTTVSSPGSTSSGYTPPSTASTSSHTSSTTVTHERFFINDGSGRETPVHFVDWNVNVRDGHMVSLVHVPGKKDGNINVFMLNHSTDWKSWSTSFFSNVAEGSVSKVSDKVGCLLVLPALPFFFIPVVTGVMIWWRRRQVVREFLPPEGPGMGGLQPLVDALKAAPPVAPPDPDAPAISAT